MNILVTGAAGFLGSHLSKRLLSEGHTVVGVDNFSTGHKSAIASLVDHDRYTFMEGCIASREMLAYLMDYKEGFDQVYNLACPTGVPNCTTMAEEMIDACSYGVKNILEVTKKNNAQFLVTSSSEIYGNPEEFPQHEEYTGNVHPTSPRSAYEEGKRFAETVTVMFYRKYGVDAKIVRLFNVYGPNMSLEDTRVVPRLVTQALKHEPMTIHNGGDQTRTFCYVDDLIEGLITVLNQGAPGEVYNLGGGDEITIKELAEIIHAHIGSESQFEHMESPLKDHHRRQPRLDKVGQLGWSQHISLEEGILKTIEDFKARLAVA